MTFSHTCPTQKGLLRHPILRVLSIALAVSACAQGGQEGADDEASGSAISQLENKISVQGEKISEMEKKLAFMEGVVDGLGRGGSGAASGGNEDEAGKLLKDIQAKMASGEGIEAKKLFDQLRSKHSGTQVYKSRSVSSLAKEIAVVGNKVSSADIAPNITKWYNSEGDLTLESGVTLLVFFEEWCPHCKREVPELIDTYDRYRGKGLKVIGLTRVTKKSTDETVETLISSTGVNYPVAKEDGRVAPKFNVSGIPAAAIVKDGVIVWRGNPARLTSAIWTKLL